MEKTYNFKEFESKIDKLWKEHNVFSPQDTFQKEPFVVVIPPPNVTGVLHMGHGLNVNIQDVLVRFNRMQGRPTLWVPGSDHAGIATQQVMDKTLATENVTRHQLGREKFIDRTLEFVSQHKKIIMNQLCGMGASVDWTRERFTLDEKLSNAVCEVFVDLYNKDLIYRGDYLVNWSVDAGTALSDDEVVYKEVQGHLYHIRYPFVDDKNREVVIATTRPETMLGDTAVAVHPNDERFVQYIGKELELPLCGRTIRIIADNHVNKEFGSGAVKITPAHDQNDYEMGKRHNLAFINILNTDGTLNNNVAEPYRGLPITVARKKIVAELEEQGYLVKIENYTHNVGHCYRTDCVVEPLFSTQWFVRMDGMAKKALQALREDKIRFYPKRWENTYVHWLENIRDWCISRQLWWGHRLPVWYNDSTGEVIVSKDDPTKDPKYSGVELRQDTDVLDTWFSSWLWPFSVMGWPEQTEDFKKYYPNSTLVTAYDIIFFWVARMIMAGLEFTGEVPFRDIYIHGLVRDDKGRKMSKSLGNGLDPLKIIDEYGADALKFTLIFMCKLGGDVLLHYDNFQLGSKFANKIWNASRFLLMNLEGVEYRDIEQIPLKPVDTWILSRMQIAIVNVEKAMKQYRLNDAARTCYEYFWMDFCDWYVEATKVSLSSGDDTEIQRSSAILLWVLIQNLKILHPFLPFITEEIYQHIQHMGSASFASQPTLLSQALYPKLDNSTLKELGITQLDIETQQRNFACVQELVTGIRTLRSEFNLSPKIKISCKIYLTKKEESNVIAEYFIMQKNLILFFIGSDNLEIIQQQVPESDNGIGVEGLHFTAMVDIKNLIDVEQELHRIKKKLIKLHTQQQSIVNRLHNKNFMEKANPAYIQEIHTQEQELAHKITQLESFVTRLSI